MMKLYEDPKIAKYNSNLKKIRILRTLTQEELAKISGVNIKSLAIYEQMPEKQVPHRYLQYINWLMH